MASNGKLEARITVPTGGWDMSLTDAAGGPTTCTLPAGEYYHSTVGSLTESLPDAIATAANAVMGQTWTCTISAAEGGTGKYTLGCDGATCTVTFTDTELRDLLGFDDNQSGSTSYTSANQAQALWLPGYPFQTPGGGAFPGKIVSDQQNAMTSSGHTFSVMGRKMRVKSLRWPMEAVAKVIAVEETTVNASFETFLIDGIYGEAAWGTSAGPVRFHQDASTDSFYLEHYVHGMEGWNPSELIEHWQGGLWPVELPKLVQVPGSEVVVSPASSYSIDTLTPTEVATITGLAEPTYMWLGKDASGATELVSGTNNLSDIVSPVKEYDSTALGGLTTQFDGSTDAMSCSADTEIELGSGAFAVMWIGRADFLGNRTFVGKRYAAGGGDGFTLYTGTSGRADWNVQTTSGAQTRSVTGQSTTAANVLLGVRRSSADEQALYTPAGSSTGSRYAESVNLAGTGALFTVGRNVTGRLGDLAEVGAVIIWTGSAAESIGETERSAVAVALGYE